MYYRIKQAASAVKRGATAVAHEAAVLSLHAAHWAKHNVLRPLGQLGRQASRGLTWLTIAAGEIYGLVYAPVTWAYGNVAYWVLRTGERVVSWFTKRPNYGFRAAFPAFNLMAAASMNVTFVYPGIWVIAMLLSPFAGVDWTRNHLDELKVRNRFFVFDDDAHYGKYEREFTDAFETSLWDDVIDNMNEEQFADYMAKDGWVRAYPQPGEYRAIAFDYLDPRLPEGLTKEIEHDAWGRSWYRGPKVDMTPPARRAKNFHISQLDNGVPLEDIVDRDERSRQYGRRWVVEAYSQNHKFAFDSFEQQKVRSLLIKDAKGHNSSWILKAVKEGYDNALQELVQAMASQDEAMAGATEASTT